MDLSFDVFFLGMGAIHTLHCSADVHNIILVKRAAPSRLNNKPNRRLVDDITQMERCGGMVVDDGIPLLLVQSYCSSVINHLIQYHKPVK